MCHGVIDLLKGHHYLRDIRGSVFGKIGSFAVSILATYALESSKFVLCLNLGRTYALHCRRKTKWASKELGVSCRCSVLVTL
jgi:hypothetical protein